MAGLASSFERWLREPPEAEAAAAAAAETGGRERKRALSEMQMDAILSPATAALGTIRTLAHALLAPRVGAGPAEVTNGPPPFSPLGRPGVTGRYLRGVT